MIKANELRIGNWVSCGTKYAKVVGEHFYLRTEDSWIREFNPIPLTPEILEKAGFGGKYKSCGYNYVKGIINLSSQDVDDYDNPIKDYVLHFYHNHQGAPIYYVHQVQNLFFALTREELEINL